MPHDPARVGQGTDEVAAEICCGQSGALALCDAEDLLKMLVQDIEEAVGKAPKEEEDSDKGDGDDGLTGRDLGGAGDGMVGDAAGPAGSFDSRGGRGTAAGCVEFGAAGGDGGMGFGGAKLHREFSFM